MFWKLPKKGNHNCNTYRISANTPIPLSMMENFKMQTCVRWKCFVNIAQGWGGAKCVQNDVFPTLMTKVVETIQLVYFNQGVPNWNISNVSYSLEWSDDRVFDRVFKSESRNIIECVGFRRVRCLVFDFPVVRDWEIVYSGFMVWFCWVAVKM